MDLHLLISILLAVEGIFYLISVVHILRHRAGQEVVTVFVSIYALLALTMLVVEIVWRMGGLLLAEEAFARIRLFVALSLTFVLVLLVRSSLRLHSEIWYGIGIFWIVVLVVFSSGILPLPNILWTSGQYSFLSSYLVPSVSLVAWITFMVGAIVSVTAVYRRTPQPLHRNRISYWLPIFILFVLNDALVLSEANPWGEVLRLLAVLLMVHMLTRVHLADVRQIFRQVFVWLAAAILIVLGYFTGNNLLRWLASTDWGVDPLLAGLVVTLFLAIGGLLLFGLARKLLSRLLPTESYNPSVTLRDYSLATSNIVNVKRLATVAVGLIMEAMGIRRGFLFLVDKETGADGQLLYRLRGVRGAGERAVRVGALSGSSPIARYFAQKRRPLLQYDLDMVPVFRHASSIERGWLSSLDIEVYVPIYSKDEWIGLFALGAKSSGNRYTDDDLNMLTTLASQSTVALENARLVDDLTRLNEEIRQAYQALDQANRSLERLEQTKSDFISIASHELRTPLTVMRGYTEMLLDDPAFKQQAAYFQTVGSIHKGMLRLNEIVNSMFDIARLDARVADLSMQAVDMPELIQFVCSGLAKPIQKRGQSLSLELPSMPAIQADQDALRKVIYHLLTNAVKFTPDGGKVTITGRVLSPNQHDLPEGGVEIVVSDTGVGVDPNYRDLIFTKFYQGEDDINKHSTGKTKFKGSGAGLGLSLARSVVEAHGGRIWVESPGYDDIKFPGSQFHVILPMRHQRDSATVRMGNAVKMKL